MAVHIGKEIEKRMKGLGMTQVHLAKRLGVHRNVIPRWLKSVSINTSHLKKASQVLEYNFFELLSQDFARRTPGKGDKDSEGVRPSVPHDSPKRTIQVTIELEDNDENRQKVLSRVASLVGWKGEYTGSGSQ